MPTYAYSALEAGGRRRRGLLEADDPRSARRRLADQGLWAERVDPVVDGAKAAPSGLRHEVRRALVYREASALLRAGLTLDRGLSMIGAMPEMASCRRALAAVCDRIREGAGPASSLAEILPMDPLESAVLAAGERSGTLDAALDRLATLLESRANARSRFISAMIYPVFVGILGLAVAVVMLGFMLPSFLRVWTEAGIELPWITRAVSGAGRLLWVAAVPVGLAVLVVVAVPGFRRGAGRAFFRTLRAGVERVGFLGRLSRASASSRFARTLAVLLRGGVPVVEALPLAGRATGRTEVAATVESLAEEVRHGLTLAAALRRAPVLSDSLGPWIEAGEVSGDLAEMLDRAADREHAVWERGLDRLMRLMEPLLILLLGGFVLLIALAILMPILSLQGV